jgi:NitT/TauT family transport system permease protein
VSKAGSRRLREPEATGNNVIRKPISKLSRGVLLAASLLAMVLGYALLSHAKRVPNPSYNPADTSPTAAPRTVPNVALPDAAGFRDGLRRVLMPRDVFVEVPQPDGSVVREARKSFFGSWYWTDNVATWGRLFAGLSMGIAAGVVIGMLMGCYTPIEAMLRLPVDFLAKIPPTAMLAVFFVTVGTERELFWAMISFGILPTLIQSVYLGARKDVPQELIDKARTLGASQPDIVGSVILRQTLPVIIESARLCVGPAMVYLIAAEWLVASEGFGYRLRLQGRLNDMSVVYLYLVVLGAAGYAIDVALREVVRRACPWWGK